jgi:hypothetical protein
LNRGSVSWRWRVSWRGLVGLEFSLSPALPRWGRGLRCAAACLILMFLMGCDGSVVVVETTGVVDIATTAPTAAAFDTGWVEVVAGMERREVDAAFPAIGLMERVVVFRVVTEAFVLRVRYTPGLPAFVSAWEPQARLVVNGNFFDENNVAQGLVVSDGEYFGQSYQDFGGMLAVDSAGGVRIRSMLDEPFRGDEALVQAVQGFPMLIRPGAAPYANEDGARARRTVLGQDAEGRLLIFVAASGLFTLSEMAAWLAAGDFGLGAALNLDGGGSTGYRAGPNDQADSITPVPVVLAVYDR